MSPPRGILERAGLDMLLEALRARGYTVVGPTERSGSIVYDELASAADLPAGRRDEQEAGTFRLVDRDDDAVFGHNVGHDSLKRWLFPPEVRVWRWSPGAAPEATPPELAPLAFVGVRSCDLHAVAIQDRVFIGDRYVDPDYAARREGAFFVAVQCAQSGGTCFCVSMDTGPAAKSGFDIALTELLDDGRHRFLVEAGSERGAEVLGDLPLTPAGAEDDAGAAAATAHAVATQGRSMDTDGIRELLRDNLEHPRWAEVADRCLSCGNCTLVCPTCFCSTVEDVTDLAGTEGERTRQWDSCFTLDHSYVHGGSVRATPPARYRQWLTHKLGTWIDQFGTSGCVGCGRCITWCPVAIDITEEVAAIRVAPD